MAKDGSFRLSVGADVVAASKNLESLNAQLAAMKRQMGSMAAPDADFAKALAAMQKHRDGVAKINDEMNKPVRDAQKRIDDAKKRLQGHLSGIASGFKNLAGKAWSAVGSVMNLIPGMAIITGAASLVGMMNLVEQTGKWAIGLENASKNLGVTVGKMQDLQGASKLFGAAPDSLANTIQAIQDHRRMARMGQDVDYARLLNLVGATSKDSDEQVLKKELDFRSHIRDPAKRRAFSEEAHISPDLVGVKDGAALQKQMDIAAKYGEVSKENAARAAEFYDAQTKVELVTHKLANTIAGELSPVLTPLLTDFADWLNSLTNNQKAMKWLKDEVKEFKEWLSRINWSEKFQEVSQGLSWLKDRFKEVVDWVSKINWGEKLEDLKKLYHGIDDVVTALGGWKTVAEILIGLKIGSTLLGLISPISRVVGAFGLLKKAKDALTGAKAAGGGAAATAEVAGGLGVLGKARRLINIGGKLFLVGEAFEGGYKVGEYLNGFKAVRDTTDALTSPLFRMTQSLGLLPGSDASDIASPKALARIGPMDDKGKASFRPSEAEQKKLATQAVAFFVKKGWSPDSAAGIVAGGKQESGFNPNAVGDNGTALGVFQWHKDRLDKIEAHFHKAVRDMSREEQYEAKDWELRNPERFAGNRVAAATSAYDAGAADSQFDERPKDVEGEKQRRGASAERIAQDYRHSIEVNFNNAPAGTQVSTKTTSPDTKITSTFNRPGSTFI